MKTKLFTLALAALTIGLLGSCKKEDPKVSVTGVTLDKTELTLTVGDPDVKLAATVLPENATDKTISWSSDKTEFATVDNQGNVHAVAPGTANITVTTTDGNKTATCAVTVKAALPEGALPGVFSVSATKKVYFSPGNLWYGTVGDAQTATFNFEANQYSSASSWEASHVSHFYWSQSVNSAIAEEYDWNGSADDVFFTNATETTAKEGFTVNVNGKNQQGWRTLSTAEWQYLFNNHSKKWATVNGVEGYVIAPDNVTLQAEKTSYTATELNDANLVFLPAAGYRNGSYVLVVGDYGHYWTSTAHAEDYAYFVSFSSPDVTPDDYAYRKFGCSVRLVTEVK